MALQLLRYAYLGAPVALCQMQCPMPTAASHFRLFAHLCGFMCYLHPGTAPHLLVDWNCHDRSGDGLCRRVRPRAGRARESSKQPGQQGEERTLVGRHLPFPAVPQRGVLGAAPSSNPSNPLIPLNPLPVEAMLGISLLSFAGYVARLALSGHIVNTEFDDLNDGVSDGLMSRANPAVADLVFFSLVSGVIGVAATGAGMLHYSTWSLMSRRAATGIGFVALMLNIVAGGYGMRVLEIGDENVPNPNDGLDEVFEALAALGVLLIPAQVALIGVAMGVTAGLNWSPWQSKDRLPRTQLQMGLAGVGAFSLLLNLIRGALAGDALNEMVSDQHDGDFSGILSEANVVAPYLVLSNIIASVVAIASAVLALRHAYVWLDTTKHAARAIGLASLCLSGLAFGFAAKHLSVGTDGRNNTELDDIDDRFDGVAGLSILALVAQLGLILCINEYGPSSMPCCYRWKEHSTSSIPLSIMEEAIEDKNDSSNFLVKS
eukprot:scaffold2952_cov312-Pinguiococcus_pyrenoidosus.AAC.19